MNENKITPGNVASYILAEDLTRSRQLRDIKELYYNYNQEISEPWCSDYLLFKREVFDCIDKSDMTDRDIESINRLLNEAEEMDKADLPEKSDVRNVFFDIIKVIKIQIMLSPKQYKRYKLRTIIGKFGYKRRSPYLVDRLTYILNELDIELYIKGNKKCSLWSIDIDDMIIMRLKTDKNN